MKRIANRSQALRDLRDMQERLILAQAEWVTALRLARSVVTDPRNRTASSAPVYCSEPERVVGALRCLQHLRLVMQPGTRYRISPQRLLEHLERKRAAAAAIAGRAAGFEKLLAQAEKEARIGHREYRDPGYCAEDDALSGKCPGSAQKPWLVYSEDGTGAGICAHCPRYGRLTQAGLMRHHRQAPEEF